MFRRDVVSVLALRTFCALTGCTAGFSPTTEATESNRTGSLEQGITVTITKVTDGDTMNVRFPNGSEETVRLLGVDTPEFYADNTPSEWETVPDTQVCCTSATAPLEIIGYLYWGYPPFPARVRATVTRFVARQP